MWSRISVRAARFTSLARRSLMGSAKSKMKQHCSIFLRRRLDFSDGEASGGRWFGGEREKEGRTQEKVTERGERRKQ